MQPTSLDILFQERHTIASKYITGCGIEIGALHTPLQLSATATVRYLDRMDVDQLRQQYPELEAYQLVPVDIVDDGETLGTLPDAGEDFVIASHFLEHCQNPILAIENMLRVIKPGGILFLVAPDKRHTFDKDRPVTPYTHLIHDYTRGPEWSRRAHYEEWVRLIGQVSDEQEIVKQAEELMAVNYSIHFHVWTPVEIHELFLYLQKRYLFETELIMRNVNEIICVIRKSS